MFDEKTNDFIPVFQGKTFDEKLEYYDSLEESENLFWNESFKKLAYFISFWYMGKISSQEDFVRAEKYYIPIQNEIAVDQEKAKSENKQDKPKEESKVSDS